MTGFDATKTTRNNAVNDDIVAKDTVNSIDPADVGNNIIQNLEALTPFIEAINAFTIYTGSDNPNDANGVEGDEYWQTNGGVSLRVWRKTTTNWVIQTVIPLGISYQDGIIIGLRTQMLGFDSVQVTSGSWAIGNVVYSKAIPTILAFEPAEIGSDRIDLIYADKLGQVLYLEGAPSGTPIKPDLPADTIEVDAIYIPASGTGLPYLFSSGTANEVPTNPTVTANQADLIDDGFGGLYLPASLPSGFVPANYAIINKIGVITYQPISLSLDGTTFTGFLDNDVQTITIKLI